MKKTSPVGFASPAISNKGITRHYRTVAAWTAIGLLFLGLFFISSALQPESYTENSSSLTQDKLFDFTRIHDIHLQFKDSAWQKLTPFGGPFGVKGVGMGWADLSLILSSPFLERGDLNYDRNLTRKEFMLLGETWFNEWNTKGDTAVDFAMMDFGLGMEGFDLRSEDGARNGIVGILGGRTPLSKADLRVGEQQFPAAEIRYKGNGTLFEAKGLKRSFKIDLNEGFPTRDLAGVTKLTLHNLTTDGGYMNDALIYRMFRDARIPAPRTSYARVFCTVPDSLTNEYLGLYLLVENVDNNFAQHWYGTKRGAMFKPVSPQLFKYRGDKWSNYIQAFDPKTPLSIQEENRIIEVCKFVTQASDEEFSRKLNVYFDLDNLARYMAITVLVCDWDGIIGPGQNIYLYLHPKTGQLSFIPWDHDHSFGQMRGTQEQRENLSIEKPWLMRNHFLERVYQEEQFKTLYHQYLEEFNNTLFKPERLLSQMKELAPFIRPAIQEESAAMAWRFDIFAGLTPDVKDTTKSHEPFPPKLPREFIEARHKAVADQLSGKSEGMTLEGPMISGFYGSVFLSKMDVNKDSVVSRQEFMKTFDTWYTAWESPELGMISYEGLRTAMNKDLSPAGPDPTKTIKTDSATLEKTNPAEKAKADAAKKEQKEN